jgi:8-amino-7-oxononanoate synthase
VGQLTQSADKTMSASWTECYEMPGPDLFAKIRAFAAHCARHRDTGLSCFRRPLLSANLAHSLMLDKASGQARKVIMLGSNSYLGLTTDPRVVEATTAAARKYGYGMGSVSLYAGTTDIHVKLEQRLADWYRCEAAVIFPSGYAANVGTISALLRPQDVAVNDLFNHASIYDGCRLSGATLHTFAHANSRHLERILKSVTGDDHGTMVITDGVFSMEGDVAPLDEILAIARKYGARVMLDDAHALGVIGPNGRGTAELYGVEGQVDVTVGALSKCLGGIGGCVAGSAALVEYLRFYGRPYFFSGAIPAPVAAGALAVLDIIQAEPHHLQDLWRCVRYMAGNLKAMGFDIARTQSPIIPVIIGDEEKLQQILLELIEAGIYMNYVSFPAVPRQRCRLRMSVMAGLSQQDMDYVLETLGRLARRHGVLQ